MQIAGIEFPRSLIAALREGRVVIFAGSGVSMGSPSDLPDFDTLAKDLEQGTGLKKLEGEAVDRFLGRLADNGTKVHKLAAERLDKEGLAHSSLHTSLLHLAGPMSASFRIVTTNFDNLFEKAAAELEVGVRVYSSPALPRGDRFTGLVHIHGSVTEPEEMVLTDGDFGRAYLVEGWARRFLLEIFENFSVLFIGYSHNDTVLQYLARALPASKTQERFALIRELDGKGTWSNLGINAFTFAQDAPDDYSKLKAGLAELVDFKARPLTEWREVINRLAAALPPLTPEDIDLISDAVEDKVKVKFFVEKATHPDWIGWLELNGHLQPLFGEGEFIDSTPALLRWLLQMFIQNHSNELFLLIGRQKSRMSPAFWDAAVWELKDAKGLSEEVLNKWLTVLTENLDLCHHDFHISALVKLATSAKQWHQAVKIFDFMTSTKLRIRPDWNYGIGEEGNIPAKLDANIDYNTEVYYVSEVWRESLRPNIASIASPLPGVALQKLSEVHQTYLTWERADEQYSPISFLRSAIEQHSQDGRIQKTVDTIVDAARDSLDFIASNDVTAAEYWLKLLAPSKEPIRRRLALHILPHCSNLDSDDKLRWILKNIGLYDRGARYEVFHRVRDFIPDAHPNVVAEIVEAILEYKSPRQDDDAIEHEAYQHFTWLSWLKNAIPEQATILEALNSINSSYPNFREREYPDLLSWSTGMHRQVDESPWSVEELLQGTARDWLDKIVGFQQDAPFGPNRAGLERKIRDAARENVEWGFALAKEMQESDEWDAGICNALAEAWSDEKLALQQYETILPWFREAEFQDVVPREIASFLRSYAQKSPCLDTETIDILCEIALQLWDHLDNTPPTYPIENWPNHAINHASGLLAEFWLFLYSRVLTDFDEQTSQVDQHLEVALEAMLSDASTNGVDAVAIMGMQFRFLLYRRKEWALQHLLPLFGSDNDGIFHAVWDGFCLSGNIDDRISSLLEAPALAAIGRMGERTEQSDSQFVRLFVGMAAYCVQNPMDSFIPEFLRVANDRQRREFVGAIESILRGMPEEERVSLWNQWLKRYWKYRCDVVKPTDSETLGMLAWLPHLGSGFPEAVDLASGLQPLSPKHLSILYNIKEQKIWVTYPEAVAKLLFLMEQWQLPLYCWACLDEIIAGLLGSELTDNIEARLRDLQLKFGNNS